MVLVLLVAVLAAAAAVVISGAWLVAASPRTVGPAPADLAAENVTIPSRSGSLLRGWVVRGEAGAGAVVVLHGVRGDRSKMIDRLRLLRGAGYSVLAIDFQAHGESPGRRITFGHFEGRDASAAVDFARENFAGERIGVIGVSLGGAAALLAPQPLPVDALVLEAVFADIDKALGNRLARHLGPAGRLLLPFYIALMPTVLPVRACALRPIDRIAEAAAPLLVIAGTADRYTTIDESRALFARATAPKQFWAVEGAAHVDLAAFAPQDYEAQVLDFLARYLRATSR